jgi:hypothetical protein
MNESEYQGLLLLAAPRHLADMRLFRRNVGVAQMGERMTRFGIKGQADIYAIVRGGRIIELEIKSLVGRLTKEQQAWRDFCSRWQVPWLLLKPMKDESSDATVYRWCAEIAAVNDEIFRVALLRYEDVVGRAQGSGEEPAASGSSGK